MNKILTNIRSVPGVWGTLAIDKKKSLIYQLMPSNYDSEIVKSIAIPALNFGRQVEKNLVADFLFENGKGRLYSTREAVIFILGRMDLNFDQLGSVCKDAIPAVNRRISRTENAEISQAGIPKPDMSIDFLITAINILASNAQRKIGAYLVTKHLRNTKDILVQRYQFLKIISIDNNGVISLMQGSPQYKCDNLIEGFANWARLFLQNCSRSSDKIDIGDIIELTGEIKDKLEPMGFYNFVGDVKQNPIPAAQ
jgi:hypothetical protein